MKRRNFFGALAGVPFLGRLVPPERPEIKLLPPAVAPHLGPVAPGWSRTFIGGAPGLEGIQIIAAYSRTPAAEEKTASELA